MTSSARPARTAASKIRAKQVRRIFVLDTNVLMHDPTSIFRFEEHDIYIPMTVLEELDAGKKGLSEAARNVRQVSRFLDELMQGGTKEEIDQGLPLPSTSVPINHGKRSPGGRLFFQTQLLQSVLPQSLPGQSADNAILANTLALQQKYPETRVTLVSKDINLRIKAAILGVQAEDYSSDKTIEDADLLAKGAQAPARKLLGKARQGHGVLAGQVTHVLSCARAAGERLADESVRLRSGRQRRRGDGAQARGRYRGARADQRLSPRTQTTSGE